MAGVPNISLDSNAIRYCAQIAANNISAANGNSLAYTTLHADCEVYVVKYAFQSSTIPALVPILAARDVVVNNAGHGYLSAGWAANLAFSNYTRICSYAMHASASYFSDTSLGAIFQNLTYEASSLLPQPQPIVPRLPATAGIDPAIAAYLQFGCGRIPLHQRQHVRQRVPETEKPHNYTKEVVEVGILALASRALWEGLKFGATRYGAGALGGPIGVAASVGLCFTDIYEFFAE